MTNACSPEESWTDEDPSLGHEKIFFVILVLLSVAVIIVSALLSRLYQTAIPFTVVPFTVTWVACYGLLTALFYREVCLIVGKKSPRASFYVMRLIFISMAKLSAIAWVLLVGARYIAQSPSSAGLGFLPLVLAGIIVAGWAFKQADVQTESTVDN